MTEMKLRRGHRIIIALPCSHWSAEATPTPDTREARGGRWGKPKLRYLGMLREVGVTATVIRTIAASHGSERPRCVVVEIGGRVIAVPVEAVRRVGS